ncbi:MAG: ATP-grasp domain-containing protein, partial [Firmicutes bacterium]|nr:ATP-grasp domain-containing protein [Bacillota bacterium]
MNIMLIYGGKSCEHDISVITACLARGYFKGELYGVYFNKNNECFLVPNSFTPAQHVESKLAVRVDFLFGEGKIALRKGRRIIKTVVIDVAVNCCHGINGEDGTVAGLCGLLNVPLVGSPVIASAVAMDKTVTKEVLQSLGIPVLNGVAATEKDMNRLSDISAKLGYPLIVKPARLGSSIGVEICKNDEDLYAALVRAFEYDDKILCEEALADFTELNCSAMRVNDVTQVSAVDCPVTANDILTFADKYTASSVPEKQKPQIERKTELQVKELTADVYDKLGFSGVIRVDYLL